MIDAEGLRIITDPYLSDYVDRPGSVRKYPAPATLCELLPDIIVISHLHGDHLDPRSLEPFYRLRRRSFTLVPAPSCEKISAIGGVPTAMHAPYAAKWGTPFELAGVRITPIPCAHTELHTTDNEHCELSYLIEAEGTKVFFGGDMSMYDGLLETLSAAEPDIMFLPVNGRDYFRTSRNIIGNLDSNEAAELAVRCKAGVFVPGHHDLYDTNGCPNAWIEYSAKRFGAPLRILAPGESIEL